jgi:hypothetical protein
MSAWSELPLELHLHIKDTLDGKDYFSKIPLLAKHFKEVSKVSGPTCAQKFGLHKEHCYKMEDKSHCQHYCYGPQCYTVKTLGDFANKRSEFAKTFHQIVPSFYLDQQDNKLSLDFLEEERKKLAAAGIVLTFPNENLRTVCFRVDPHHEMVDLQRVMWQIHSLLRRIPSPYAYVTNKEGKLVPTPPMMFSRQDAEQLHRLLQDFLARYKNMRMIHKSSISNDAKNALDECLWEMQRPFASLHLLPHDPFPNQLMGWPYMNEIYKMLSFIDREALQLI